MTDYRTMYDKEFIGAWDLAEGDKTITITKCVEGKLTGVGGRKSKKPVVYFRGSEKGFALNSTNGKTIAALYGNHVEKWAGKRITLFKSTTRNPDGTGDVDCIRVRPQEPKAGADSAFGGADEDPRITTAQADELQALCAAKGVDAAELLKVGKLAALTDMLATDFDGAKKFVEKKAKAAAGTM